MIAGPAPAAIRVRAADALQRLEEVLRATGPGWRVRRAGADAPIDLRGLRRELEALSTCEALALVVIVGAIASGERGTYLVTEEETSSNDDYLWFAALAATLDRCVAPSVVVARLVDGSDQERQAIADRLAGPDRLVAVEGDAGEPAVLGALISAFSGAALEVRLGAITGRSLSEHLALEAPAALIRGGLADTVLVEAPPLDRLWQLGVADHSVRPFRATRVAAPSDGDDLIGVTLPGRFRIDARIAAGTGGVVYRAHQISVGRDVAVKVLHDGIDPFSEEGALFAHEVRAVGKLDHPNIVRVLQSDATSDGRLFFAMELVAGRDLQAIIDDGELAPSDVLPLAGQLLSALGAAHQAGIVHADVKPGNMLVTGEGQARRLILVDFGLARLRRPDGTGDVAGGTPAFMSPEQLRRERIDARSDLFSGALVIVAMYTGWRRSRAAEVVPPPEVLSAIADPDARAVLDRALAVDVASRFATAEDFAAALAGARSEASSAPHRPVFHGLASFGEDDHDRLHGRDDALRRLTDLALHRRIIIVTAPSGVGKTSLLCAGLVPRLRALSVATRYLSCRADVAPPAPDLAAVSVLVLDQLEAVLEAEGRPDGSQLAAFVDGALREARRTGAQLTVVAAIREDFLARLIGGFPGAFDGAPVFRVGPLSAAGAREAITRPLAERRLAIDEELLARLIRDLTAAGLAMGRELGWTAAAAIYPPHLQLACVALVERAGPEESRLSLSHYTSLGGLDAIVGEHLDRVLDELDQADSSIARDLFLALVTAGHARSARTEDEIADVLGHPARLGFVLETLQRQGLMVRVRRAGGDPVWELIHDSLVPRVLAWVDRQDLARRRVVELVRYHLRRSRPDAPSLLSRRELRELASHGGAVAELQADWEARFAGDPDPARWSPKALVARSRRVARRATLGVVVLTLAVGAGVGAAVYTQRQAAADRRAEVERRDRDLGLFTLELAPFDWDPSAGVAVAVPVAELPELRWALHRPAEDDPHAPGEPLPFDVERGDAETSPDGTRRTYAGEAPGGAAILVVSGRGRPGQTCEPSIVPLRGLPGYAQRGDGPRVLRVRVPTCDATLAGMVEVGGGRFVFGGLGEPRSDYQAEFPERVAERIVDLPAFRIDATEVTNAAYDVFASMKKLTGFGRPVYVPNAELARATDPRSPASGITWHEARAYCRYLGKRLPTSEEWEKSLRGGLRLGSAVNPAPRRNFPWGTALEPHAANLSDERPRGVKPVGSYARDRSVYGVLDLAGNVGEWVEAGATASGDDEVQDSGWRVTRGGNWSETTSSDLVNFTPIENARVADNRSFALGARCALGE